ncbi:hypothetical protein Daus18300_006180 [Diaporthe australafricana]|uniref:Uncharacterized protein n=1 Tax=Diaporthe australafricana TaxID=127596 RepID=A0ABR3WW52_9PEZI
MAENNPPVVVRSKLLPNNSAAEFVELRADRFLGAGFSRPNGTEYAPGVDMFVDQGVASSLSPEKYYQASRDKRKEFEVLLVNFAKLVDDRQLQKRFYVKSKSLQDYKIQDVLEIAEKVQTTHGSTPKVKEHTAVFKKCFAAVGRNSGALKNLLNFIPDDSYGSIIFGGFTMILTAIERAETLREIAYAALAEIPRKLEFINSLTKCVRSSTGLYQAGDAVLVALFGALAQIIDELTKSKSNIPADARKDPGSTKLQNEKFAKDWLSSLPLHFQDLAVLDMDELLERSTSLSMDDQGKIQYIMANPLLFDWLNTQKSMVILIQSEVAPDDSINPLSFSSAFLARSLRGTYKSPVLYYNCRSRSRESSEEDLSGPLALIDTFNAQLVGHLLDTLGDSIGLDFLQQNGLSKTSPKHKNNRLRHGRRVFKRLIEELPEPDVVFIIIDGMSWLTGDQAVADKVLRLILELARQSMTRIIKMLLTDVLSRTVLDDYEYLDLFVHGRIDSTGQPLNLDFLREETQKSLATSS